MSRRLRCGSASESTPEDVMHIALAQATVDSGIPSRMVLDDV